MGIMPTIPSRFVYRDQLDAEIKNAVHNLGPEAVHVAYNIGEDSTGIPSIFFRIVLADSSIHEETLSDMTWAISSTIMDQVAPIENWGLHPYFNFRSESEHRTRIDPAWTMNGISR